MTNLDSIFKSRDIALLTKVCLVKAMVFPVVMYGCESWTVKRAECQRIDVFELWCWRRLLRVPWTARRSNKSILKEISLGISLKGMKLKLQYFGHLMRRVDSLEKTTLGVGDGQGGLACCDSWGPTESDTTEWLNWTELRQHIKKQRHYFANKGPCSQSFGFSNSHVWMWEFTIKTVECRRLDAFEL